jgi:hypothetical protein
MTMTLGALGIALLHVLAWASARSTIYTLTNRPHRAADRDRGAEMRQSAARHDRLGRSRHPRRTALATCR